MTREEYINDIIYSFIQLRRGFVQSIAKDQSGSLPHAQGEALMCVSRTGELAAKDLAQKLGVTPGAATQLVDALENADLVERKNDYRDKRITKISVSKKGRAALSKSRAKRLAKLNDILQPLNDSEVKTLSILLKKLNLKSIKQEK